VSIAQFFLFRPTFFSGVPLSLCSWLRPPRQIHFFFVHHEPGTNQDEERTKSKNNNHWFKQNADPPSPHYVANSQLFGWVKNNNNFQRAYRFPCVSNLYFIYRFSQGGSKSKDTPVWALNRSPPTQAERPPAPIKR
jgi:hypothetical protein